MKKKKPTTTHKKSTGIIGKKLWITTLTNSRRSKCVSPCNTFIYLKI